MKKFIVILSLFFSFSFCFAADTPSVYEVLDQQVKLLEALPLEEMVIEVSLTEQEIVIHKGSIDGEKNIVAAFPCSTGPGKYAMVPESMKTVIYETGPGSEGNRPSYSNGGVMKHCLRLKMKNSDGTEAYVAIHSANGEYVPRLPTTHGCIRVPNRVAKALFQKVWDGVPGKTKGGVRKEVPVFFTGKTPVLDFGN